MKVKPYTVKLVDGYILGPCVFLEDGRARVGLSLGIVEVGLEFDSERVYRYGCSGCGKLGKALLDELPPGWEKRYRPDHTYYFLCDKCRGTIELDEDYIVTDENRAQAIDEIIGQLTDREDNDLKVKALRDYANELLDEAENYSKYDLSQAVCSYFDGFEDAWKIGQGEP